MLTSISMYELINKKPWLVCVTMCVTLSSWLRHAKVHCHNHNKINVWVGGGTNAGVSDGWVVYVICINVFVVVSVFVENFD